MKKIALFGIAILFSLTMVNALDYYENDYFSIQLVENPPCLINCNSVIRICNLDDKKIKLDKDYVDLWVLDESNNVVADLENEQIKNPKIKKLEVYVLENVSVTVRDYGQCQTCYISNVTQEEICSLYICQEGTHQELKEQYVPMDLKTAFKEIDPNNCIDIKISGEKRYNSKVDWKIKLGVDNVLEPDWAWWDGDWDYKDQLLLENRVNADFENITTNVTINTTALYEAGKLQDDCDDIRIINETGNYEHPYEIEECFIDGSNNGLTTIWLLSNFTSLSNTTHYFYYGNPTAPNGEDVANTWDNNYLAVHHFTQINSVDVKNSYDFTEVTNGGTAYTLNYTPFGRGVQMYNDGSNTDDQTYYTSTLSASNDIGSGNDFTIEVYLIVNEPVSATALFQAPHSGAPRFYLRHSNYSVTSSQYIFGLGGEGTLITNPINYYSGQYQQLVGRYDGSVGKVTLNGTEDDSHTYGTESFPSEGITWFGHSQGGIARNGLNGTVDELRVSTVYRSDDWIEFNYFGTHSYFLGEETQATTTTTPTPTTTTLPPVEVEVGLGNYTTYSCTDNYLVYNLTQLTGNSTDNSTSEILSYEYCEFGCSSYLSRARCEPEPFLKWIIFIIILLGVAWLIKNIAYKNLYD